MEIDANLPEDLFAFIEEHRDVVESEQMAVKSDLELLDFIEARLNRTRYVQSDVTRLGIRPDTLVVYFRDFNTGKDAFHIELKKSDTCKDVVMRVADQLEVDENKIRLRVQECFRNEPEDETIDYECNGSLWDKLLNWDKVSDTLYYEVLDQSLPELKKLRTIYVECSYPPYTTVKVVLPKASIVEDLLAEVKERMEARLSNPNAKLRLLGISNGKIDQILRLDSKIEDILDYSKLRAEEVPDEEKNLAPSSSLIRVYHFTVEDASHIAGKIFGNPFLFIIKRDDTLIGVKKRLAKKLDVSYDEVSKWKFVLLSPTVSKYYVEDNDVLWNHFEHEKDACVQLGLEHSATDYYNNKGPRTY